MNIDDLSGNQGEVDEITFSFHFDEDRKIIIDRWRKLQEKEFSKDQIAEIYTLASRTHIEASDMKVTKVLSNYLSQTTDNQNMGVYSLWREGIKVEDVFKQEVPMGKDPWEQAL